MPINNSISPLVDADVIRIVIVDDHPIVRAGIKMVLSMAPDLKVIAEGESGSAALQLVKEYHPDVLILDINLPDFNGVEVSRRLRREDHTTAILVLTIHNDDQTIFELLKVGVNGYVLKDDALETLTTAVYAVTGGQEWLSPGVTRRVISRAIGSENEPLQTSLGLTERELEILFLLAEGMSNDTIAHHLNLAKRTVQNHISTIYGKLGVNTRAEAILFAIRNKFVRVLTV